MQTESQRGVREKTKEREGKRERRENVREGIVSQKRSVGYFNLTVGSMRIGHETYTQTPTA